MVFPQFDKDACYQFFKNCFSRSKINRFNIPAWMPQYDNPKKSFNLQPPSYRDISKIISKIKAGAPACSLDQVSVLTLKKCPYLRTYLTCLIQKLWKGQNIQSVWKKAVTILIYKSDDPSNPKNFRPITLENVFLKVYAAFIRNRIFEYLKANDYIEFRVQKGFIPEISGTIEPTQQLHTASIGTKTFVTSPLQVEKGVLQGGCLSPLLFNMLFNTFIQTLTKSKEFDQRNYRYDNIIQPRNWFQFADDAAAVTSSEYKNQILLNVFTRWCNWSGMTIRVDRCKTFGIKNTDQCSLSQSCFS